jgi:hypothetical protein
MLKRAGILEESGLVDCWVGEVRVQVQVLTYQDMVHLTPDGEV